MKPGLQVGELREIVVMADEQSRATLLGGPVHPLYGTAGMIAHMEWAARHHILPYLEEGEDGVGYHVNVTHLKPAPLGAEIRIRSEVTDIQPKRVTSQIEVWWETQKIGEGTFVQALVSREKLYACVAPRAELSEQPPAELRDSENNSRFSLQLLRWEHEFSACTRYDEWLVTRMQINSVVHEGAFLLRCEIEEWQQACYTLLNGESMEYRSDFLEPVLSISMHATGQEVIQVSLFTSVDGESDTQRFQVAADVLGRFADSLAKQLSFFPSLL